MRKFLCALLVCCLSLICHQAAFAGAFTPGNLVVYHIGDVTGNAAQVTLEEYQPNGTLKQSIVLPSASPTPANGNRDLTASGSSTASAEGLISRSPDGQYLAITGYNAFLGKATVVNTTSTTINRVVGIVDASGNVDTTTSLTNSYSANNIRSAVTTDGTTIYTSGQGSGSGASSTAGVRSTTKGSTTAMLTSTTVTDTRQLNIFNNTLYFSTAVTSAPGIYSLGSPPTVGTTGVTATRVIDTSSGSSPNAFYFADVNTVYVADDRVNGSGGIQKYISNGGSFTLAYTLIPGTNIGTRGLTGNVSGSNVTLYATTNEGSSNTLVSITDPLAATAAPGNTFTTIATAPANTVFRGVAFAPVASTTAVKLISFTATRYSNSVWLNWQTGYEVDNLGFNVYREVKGKKVRLNRGLIAGSALQMGANGTGGYAYAWPDTVTVSSAKYWLEDLDTSGKSTWHGPVTPRPGSGSAGTQRRSATF